MRYARCKCGKCESWSSGMPEVKCQGCDECGTTLSGYPTEHKTPEPHNFVAEPIEADQPGATLSRCSYCHKTKAQIEKMNARKTS